MSDSNHINKLLTTEDFTPLTPENLTPEIRYDQESDTLWIGNGRPVPNGMDLFDGCVVFFDQDRRVSGIMIEDAMELLLPFLNANIKSNRSSAPTGNGAE